MNHGRLVTMASSAPLSSSSTRVRAASLAQGTPPACACSRSLALFERLVAITTRGDMMTRNDAITSLCVEKWRANARSHFGELIPSRPTGRQQPLSAASAASAAAVAAAADRHPRHPSRRPPLRVAAVRALVHPSRAFPLCRRLQAQVRICAQPAARRVRAET